MSYNNQLASPAWQQRRLHIFERDKWTCRAAGCHCKTKQLHVHHIEYFDSRQAWEYPDDMLMTLCDDCHKKENSRNGLEKMLANTFKMHGYLVSDLTALSCLLESDKRFSRWLLFHLRQFQING